MRDPQKEVAELYVIVRPGEGAYEVHLELTGGETLTGHIDKDELRMVAVAMLGAWIVTLAGIKGEQLPLDRALRVTQAAVRQDIDSLTREAMRFATSWINGPSPANGTGKAPEGDGPEGGER